MDAASNQKSKLNIEGYIYLIAFISTIFFANYFIKNVGTVCIDEANTCLIPMIPIFGFGDGMAPSGVLWAGIAFTLRDLVQRRLGIRWSIFAIIVGGAVSAIIDPALALASGFAFVLAETLDLFVYTPLQNKRLILAVIASNLVGLTVDTFVFLSLAGIPLNFAESQIVGKLWMTILFVPIVYLIREFDKKRLV